jgi:hypothetical protein
MRENAPLTDEYLEEVRRLYPRNHPLRKMVRDAVRAVGLPPSAEEVRLIAELSRRSGMNLKTPAHELDDETGLAITLAFKAVKVELGLAARDHQMKSALKRHKNRVERDCWIRQQYAQKKHEHTGYSIARFRMDLVFGVLSIPRKFSRTLRYKGKIIGIEALRRVVNAR